MNVTDGYKKHKGKVYEDAKIACIKHINSLNLAELVRPKQKIEVKDNDMILWFMKQNPEKNSQWAQLARDGRHVVQIIMLKPWFEYLGVVLDCKNITFYERPA